MQIKIFKDYNALSLHAANEIIRAITLKPDSVLCLAAGDTPRLTYRLLKDRAREEKISLSR